MGTALRSRSELPEVMLGFEGRALLAERLGLGALHGKVRTGQGRAERSHEHGVGLQALQRRAQGGRVAMYPALLPLAVGQGTRIDENGIARFELPRDAVEPGGE